VFHHVAPQQQVHSITTTAQPIKKLALEKELLVKSTPTEVEIALIEDRKLVELHTQKSDTEFAVGDIFLGYIKMLRPSLNAAFLDVGVRKDAFLHYTDLGPQIKSVQKFTKIALDKQTHGHLLEKFVIEADNEKNGKIDRVFKKNQPCLVQILKEPISTKGPRLTCEITLAGRFMVMTPFKNNVSVSKKITSQDERKRLKVLVDSIRPKNFGIIIRTAAEGKKVADLHDEINNLTKKWDSILYASAKTYLGSVAPEKVKILSHYKGKKPLFDNYGIHKQIKSSFTKTPTMSSGAYLVIEHTEAMHVIDVNSGPKSKNRDQETAALQVNLEAAKEIARQLRLRDLGGLIVIDFIDMRNKENKNILYSKMKEYMSGDRAQHTVLPLSKFGLTQITRQRVKPELKINTLEVCPSCKGSGNIEPAQLLPDEIERNIKFIVDTYPNATITLKVNPLLYTYFKKGIITRQMRWRWEMKKWIHLVSDSELQITQFKFYNKYNDEIRLDAV